MLIIFILFFLFVILNSFTTIPFPLAILGVSAVIFRKSWVFFTAFFLGLIIDLFQLRFPGQTALFFVIFVFFLFLYKRKFETRTLTFVFFATFLGGLIYLLIFGYNNVLVQSLINAVAGVLLFKFLWLRLGRHSEIT